MVTEFNPRARISRANAVKIAVCIERARSFVTRLTPGDRAAVLVTDRRLRYLQEMVGRDNTTSGKLVDMINDNIVVILDGLAGKLTGQRAQVTCKALVECKSILGCA